MITQEDKDTALEETAEVDIVHKNLWGRPLAYTPDELEDKLIAYEIHCNNSKKPKTITGFTAFLEVDRDWIAVHRRDERFSHIIKKLDAKCESDLVTRGLIWELNPSMTIFLLKNHYGYADKSEVKTDMSVKLTPQQVREMPSEELLKLVAW